MGAHGHGLLARGARPSPTLCCQLVVQSDMMTVSAGAVDISCVRGRVIILLLAEALVCLPRAV